MRMGFGAAARAGWDTPLRRLSRFDGVTFHPVDEASVTERHVHVFVHGWQPGFRLQERLHAITDLVPALPAWDPRLIDPVGRTLSSYHVELLGALAALGPDHCVLHYSWIDESATDARVMLAYRSRQATQVNGRRLAAGLQQVLKNGESQLHLIGHSHGSAVAVHAAAALGRTPRQVTLLDAPENRLSRLSGAANLIDVVLPRIRPTRDDEGPFVDSYASVFGRPYHRKGGLSSVVDVSLYAGLALKPTFVEALSEAHLYAVDWYALSVREAERGVGYGWSPLYDGDVKHLSSYYHSRGRKKPLTLGRRAGLAHLMGAQRPLPAPRRDSRVTDIDLHLNRRYPASAKVLRLLPGDGLITFDVEIDGGDGDEQILLELDAVPVFIGLARYPVPRSGRYVVLTDGSAGEHLLTARLVTDASTRAWPRVLITNVTIESWPDAMPGFTMERVAMRTFVSGLVVGGAGTLFTQMLWKLLRWTLRPLPRIVRRMLAERALR
ncbi:hypothetical protein [Kineosporia succinea]|uniref:FHA domain-containing protein n=1 Tax=Kineosporia succinea TaxID=84632 RepID=A0ABT9P9Y3_9ACTN|nr:hypothetical protein [Kineosporia succinea]MDP9828845.1 hypothetical protein [Kineosporia succinea]